MLRQTHPFVIESARKGIFFASDMQMLPREELKDSAGNFTGWGDVLIGELSEELRAFDAQPGLITTPNAGIPVAMTTLFDPKLIQVILTPNNAVKLYGEVQKGNWLIDTVEFPMVENTGEVSSYGDYSPNGRSGANVQWVPRQPYLYQGFVEYGDREVARMGVGRIDWVSQLAISQAMTFDKFRNQSYFFGVRGLDQFGALNDPDLSPALTPMIKAAGGTSWARALPTEIFADVQAAFVELQAQTGSNLELDTPLVLGLSSISQAYLTTPNSFGLNAMEMLKGAFPNLRVQQAPQFQSGTVYSFQLFVPTLDGQTSVECAYNEMMRAHRVIMDSSSVKQKKSAGTIGTIWYRPICVASMSGI